MGEFPGLLCKYKRGNYCIVKKALIDIEENIKSVYCHECTQCLPLYVGDARKDLIKKYQSKWKRLTTKQVDEIYNFTYLCGADVQDINDIDSVMIGY